jgi:hypothetical protein
MHQGHLFVFGRHPALSLAELLGYARARRLSLGSLTVLPAAAVVPGAAVRPEEFARDLAGVVKLAVAAPPAARPSTDSEWVTWLEPHLVAASLASGSLTFGVSFYGAPPHRPSAATQQRLALALKERLRRHAGHVRWVSGRGQPLSSVQVATSGLVTPGGCELVVVCDATTAYLGRTVAVQPFASWSERDYGRPRRNMVQGMLPPKLARMMVNMLGLPPRGRLLDPFCGSGTVLAEAAALGWTDLVGADENVRAVRDTAANLAWLWRHASPPLVAAPQLLACPVEQLASRLPASSVQAIVTEPFLGPPRTRPVSEAEFRRLSRQLLALYRTASQTFAMLLASGGRAVFVLPRWVTARGEQQPLPLFDQPLPRALRRLDPLRDLPLLAGTPLVYHRPGQYVAREIVILEHA